MRTARFLASIAAPILIVACAVGTAPVDTNGGGGGENDASTIIIGDGSYGGSIVDGAFVPPPDASAHGGVDAGAKDSGTTTVPDSGTTTPPPTSDECPSGNTTAYDAEWYFSETPCTPGNGDCDPGDCCFDRGFGDGDPYCITP